MTRCNNDVLMLTQRLRRWPNIKTSLFQRVVFTVKELIVMDINVLVNGFYLICIRGRLKC